MSTETLEIITVEVVDEGNDEVGINALVDEDALDHALEAHGMDTIDSLCQALDAVKEALRDRYRYKKAPAMTDLN